MLVLLTVTVHAMRRLIVTSETYAPYVPRTPVVRCVCVGSNVMFTFAIIW